MATIVSYTKAKLDELLGTKLSTPGGATTGQALVKTADGYGWGSTGSSNAGDLTTGTLPPGRIGDSSIQEGKLATGTMMTVAERQKLSGIATNATSNRSDADTDTLIGTKASTTGSVRVALWNGSVYQIGGVTVTSANRPSGSYIQFVNGPDPSGITPSLGVVNGDSWKAAS